MKRNRRSIRLKNYDYSRPGGYFVTICAKNRNPCFGQIVNEKINLSPVGKIVEGCWLGIPEHFKNVKLDEWVIMPNHIHGIIIIDETKLVGTDYNLSLPLRSPRIPSRNRFQNVILRSLSYVIATSKSAVSRKSNRSGSRNDFAWQPRFYEHVIRSENELNRIRQYIQNNPLQWELDRENPISKNFNLDHDTYWKEVYE
jgi:putative transposase